MMVSDENHMDYYANCNNTSIFDQFCLNMELFFKGSKWQCFNLTK